MFAVGNGTSNGSRSNAITTLKNGNSGFGNITPVSTVDVNGTFGTKVKASLNAGSNHPDGTATVWIYSTGTGTINLPVAATCANRRYVIVNNTGGTLNISSYVGIGGASLTGLGTNVSMELVSDGTSWYQIR